MTNLENLLQKHHKNYDSIFVITTPVVNFKVNHEYVQSKLSDSNSILLDTRSPDEFNGVIAAGPKAGRIPGSINFPWEIGVGTDGYVFKNIEELDKIFEKYGITKDKEIICYCQVGERASHTFVALQFCNYPNVKITTVNPISTGLEGIFEDMYQEGFNGFSI